MRSSSILALALLLPLLAGPAFGEPDDPRPIVQASEILAKIERGEPVEYDGVIVEGDLDLSGLDLPTKHVERTKFDIEFLGLTEEVKLVESSMSIKNSEIRGDVNLENAIIQEAVNFSGTDFSGYAYFGGINFSGDANFSWANFSGDVDFSGANFSGDANFGEANFSGDADFGDADFSSYAAFGRVNFRGDAYFGRVNFRSDAYFGEAKFSDGAEFRLAIFNDGAVFILAIFSGCADFGYADFSGDAIFDDANFSGYADFGGTNFSGDANFSGANFSGDADFLKSQFSGDANFLKAQLSGNADFCEAQFSSSADFWEAQFIGSTDFKDAEFSGDAIFEGANFRGGADFREANFRSDAYFMGADSNGDTIFEGANFNGNDVSFEDSSSDHANLTLEDAKTIRILRLSNSTFENESTICLNGTEYERLYVRWGSIKDALVYSGEVYLTLVKNFKAIEYFEDADDCYYQYRRERQSMRSWGEVAKYTDILGWITCGYGVRPGYTLLLGLFVVLVSAFYYWRRDAIRRLKGDEDESAKFSDAFYFSMMTFTTVGYGDWYPLDRHRKVVMIEGIVGWLTLSLFLVTLANVIIR